MDDDKAVFSASVVLTCMFLAGLILIIGIIAKGYVH
jgi:hypothetical protein